MYKVWNLYNEEQYFRDTSFLTYAVSILHTGQLRTVANPINKPRLAKDGLIETFAYPAFLVNMVSIPETDWAKHKARCTYHAQHVLIYQTENFAVPDYNKRKRRSVYCELKTSLAEHGLHCEAGRGIST